MPQNFSLLHIVFNNGGNPQIKHFAKLRCKGERIAYTIPLILLIKRNIYPYIMSKSRRPGCRPLRLIMAQSAKNKIHLSLFFIKIYSISSWSL